MGKIIELIDRSRVDAREECPRLRFLNYDLDGTGIEPEGASLPLLGGIAIHAAHARLVAGESLELVISESMRDYVAEFEARGLYGLAIAKDMIREQAALLESMLRAWFIVRLPMILEEYDVVSIEEKFDWQLAPGLVQRLRFDVVLRRKADSVLFILDYKTMSYPSEMWADKFEHNNQTCLYLQALKERFPHEVVGGILYEGLVKGLYRKDTARNSPWFGQKIQASPYTIAYMLASDDGTSLNLYQTEYTAKKGWQKVRVFDWLTPKQWVEEHLIPQGKLNELFIVLPPICPPNYELLEVKEQTIREELAYLEQLALYRKQLQYEEAFGMGDRFNKAPDLLNRMAPKRTNRCFKYGADNKCAMVQVCFTQGFDPLVPESGYRKRTPHHDTTMEITT